MATEYWFSSDDGKHAPWQAGFTPTEIIECSSSGGQCLGHIADIVNTSANGMWPVTAKQLNVDSTQLLLEEISAGWRTARLAIRGLDDTVYEILSTNQVKTTAEKIEQIRDSFGLSVSHLAKVLCTSRPSIYKWLEGEEPRQSFVQRIEMINQIACKWSNMNPYHFAPGPMLRQPLGELPSLLELLEQESIDTSRIDNALDILVDLMNEKSSRMEQAKKRSDASNISESDKLSNRHALTESTGSSD